uniref:Uncharacterized protein n=1 Tax=Cacopsylla melanoneura TaxID=428564 RepID=A0A8D9B421_9HEMI
MRVAEFILSIFSSELLYALFPCFLSLTSFSLTSNCSLFLRLYTTHLYRLYPVCFQLNHSFAFAFLFDYNFSLIINTFASLHFTTFPYLPLITSFCALSLSLYLCLSFSLFWSSIKEKHKKVSLMWVGLTR